MGKLTYSDAGVDREKRKEAKKFLNLLESTHIFSKYGDILKTPFNNLYPINNNKYQVKTCDGIGTKVLLAQLAGKHDTIGIDGIAMVVNDCIRCGAKPIALTDVIDIKKSNPELLGEIEKGLRKGCFESKCPLVGGETADVPELMSTEYHINCDCVGEVEKKNIITGRNIIPDNLIIGLKSSGIHSNGISLARRVLFKEWGGKFDAYEQPDNFDRELIYEVLEPTRIYVKSFLKLMSSVDVLGAVHITGDAYLKFKRLMKYSKKIGFEFNNFKPQPIFNLIKEAGNVEKKEMFKTFNMGWGFAVIVDKNQADNTIDILEKQKIESEVIGKITNDSKVLVKNYSKIIL